MPPILSSTTHPNGRHRRINDRTSCIKQSQLSCQRQQSIKLAWMLCRAQPRVNKVNFLLRKTPRATPQGRALVFFRIGALGASTIAILLRQILTSNPFRGESLLASTEQPVYRLSPHLLRRGGFRRGCGAPLQVKRGRGSFRKSRNLS